MLETKWKVRRFWSFVFFWIVTVMAVAPRAFGGDAPSWMRVLVSNNSALYDEKTEAVLLYSDTTVTVLSQDKIRTHVREAYRILRPEGRGRGTLGLDFGPSKKITSLRGWCIPAQGKDYEVKEKDAVDVASAAEGGYLVEDTKYRVLAVPAPDPGSIVGYEYEVEERPYFLQDIWRFQEKDPVRESHYALQLPAGWVFKASWVGHDELKPEENGSVLRWTINDVKAIRPEPEMPPWHGLAGQMIVSFFPSGGTIQKKELVTWADMGQWYGNLLNGRMDTTDAMKQEVRSLTSGKATLLQKTQSVAEFVQHDVRYVAIELGIGGFQPHTASEVFSHRYGDCKDKATLLRAMLSEIGVESYHVVINTQRGSVGPKTPAHSAFNHAILAIKVTDKLDDPSLIAVTHDSKLGKLLFFDPTNEVMPFGQIGGYLQANYGLLVTPDGGELVELPTQPSNMNGIARTGRLTLQANGTLQGDVEEIRLGDRAAHERQRLRAVTKDSDRIKPIEDVLNGSLSNFHITKAGAVNLDKSDQPLGFQYTFQSLIYGKQAGDLLLVRPRVLGSKSSSVLETKEPRKFAFEFEGPVRDTDTFDIALPTGYEVDELPPPTDVDYSFGSYHSKSEQQGHTLHYTRSLEIKELSVPVNQMDELKKFYRVISADERSAAVLKPAGGSAK